MKNKGYFIVLVCCLVFYAGYITGKHIEPIDVFQWTPELKFGDLIASLIALITFIFAYKGFEDNRKQYFSSIKPIIAQHHYHKRDAHNYIWAIHNYGNGIATKINYAIHFREEEVSLSKLATLMNDSSNQGKPLLKNSTPHSAPSSSKIEFLNITCVNIKNYEKVEGILKEVIVKISYEDLLGNTYSDSFPYVE